MSPWYWSSNFGHPMKLIRVRNSKMNGRFYYRSTDGLHYTFKNPGWGWSVGRVEAHGNQHIEDVRILADARRLIAKLSQI